MYTAIYMLQSTIKTVSSVIGLLEGGEMDKFQLCGNKYLTMRKDHIFILPTMVLHSDMIILLSSKKYSHSNDFFFFFLEDEQFKIIFLNTIIFLQNVKN